MPWRFSAGVGGCACCGDGGGRRGKVVVELGGGCPGDWRFVGVREDEEVAVEVRGW